MTAAAVALPPDRGVSAWQVDKYEGERTASAIAEYVLTHLDSAKKLADKAAEEALKPCGNDACGSCKTEDDCGAHECLWDEEEAKCGPRYVTLFGHKIDLLEVKKRAEEDEKAEKAAADKDL